MLTIDTTRLQTAPLRASSGSRETPVRLQRAVGVTLSRPQPSGRCGRPGYLGRWEEYADRSRMVLVGASPCGRLRFGQARDLPLRHRVLTPPAQTILAPPPP